MDTKSKEIHVHLLNITWLGVLVAVGVFGAILITLGWKLSNDIKMKTDTALL